MEKTIISDISLVIPCYNEEFRLNKEEFISFSKANPHVTLCLVNDGSKDKTKEIIEELQRDCHNIYSLHISENVGKAEAVRRGILYIKEQIQTSYIGYFDADLSTPLDFANQLQLILETEPQLWMVFGSRQLAPQEKIKRRKRRHAAGRIVSKLINLSLNIHFADTQCGAKLFRRNTIEALFEEPFVSTWVFDVELIHRIKKIHPHTQIESLVKEIPVSSWHDVGESKVSPFYFFKLLRELVKIRRS